MLCHTWLQKWDMIHFTVKSRRARSNLKSPQQIAGLWGFCLPRAFSLFSLMGSLGQQFKGDCDSCHLLRLLALSLAVILSLIALNSESTSTVAKNSVWNWNSNYINFSNCQCSVREATSKHRTGTQREKPLYQAGFLICVSKSSFMQISTDLIYKIQAFHMCNQHILFWKVTCTYTFKIEAC